MSVELLIDALGPKGDGIHRSDQGPVYVDRALPGDLVRVNIARGAGGAQRGDLLAVVTASPHRVTAPCPNYDVCGGCTLQHADDQFYRTWKTEIVRDALSRAGLTPESWGAPVFLPDAHRRRVTFAAFKKKNAVTLGYFRRRSHEVSAIATCLTADPAIMALRTKLATLLVPVLQDGKAADIFIQAVDGQCEVVMTGPVGAKGRPDLQVYEAVAALAHAAKVSRIAWRPQERDAAEVMIEIEPVRAKFGMLDVALPSLAFLQPTKAGEQALVAAVMEHLPGTGKFADLFAGCGTFSGPMLERGPVDAFESAEPAIQALDRAKGSRPLRGIARDLFRNPLRPDETKRYDALVFDPPRAGAEEQARALTAGTVPRLIGVSCNPVTFARDARILVDGGYRFQSIKVIDQFTWSHHVEVVASFSKAH